MTRAGTLASLFTASRAGQDKGAARLRSLAACAQADAQGRLGREDRPYPERAAFELALNAFRSCRPDVEHIRPENRAQTILCHKIEAISASRAAALEGTEAR